MRFLVDECCPRTIAEALRVAGHDVVYVVETLTSEADARLADLATREGYVLVSADYDFADMVVRDGVSIPGLVLIDSDLNNESPVLRAERLIKAVQEAPHGLAGYITVVGKRVRQRRLPA